MKLSPSGAAIVVVTIRVAGVVCQAATLVVLTNLLPPHEVGIFAVVYAFWGLVRMLGPVGSDHIILREVAAARTSGNYSVARALTWLGVKGVLIAGVALGALTAVVLMAIGQVVEAPLTWSGIIFVAGTVPGFALLSILTSALRGFDRNTFSQTLESLLLHVLALGFIVSWSLKFETSLNIVLACHALAAWIIVAVCLMALARWASGPKDPIAYEVRQRVRAQSFEVWQALVLIGIADRAPNYISLAVLGPVPTAILEIALRFGILPTIFTTGVSITFSPIFAGLYVREEFESIGNALAVGSWLAFVPSICTFFFFLVFGPYLLALVFPPIYQEAFSALLVVMVASAINAAYGLSSSILLMTGHQRIVRTYSFLRLAGVVTVGVLAGYWFGIVGISLSILLGFVIFDVGLAQRVHPQLNVSGFLHLRGLSHLYRTLHPAG